MPQEPSVPTTEMQIIDEPDTPADHNSPYIPAISLVLPDLYPSPVSAIPAAQVDLSSFVLDDVPALLPDLTLPFDLLFSSTGQLPVPPIATNTAPSTPLPITLPPTIIHLRPGEVQTLKGPEQNVIFSNGGIYTSPFTVGDGVQIEVRAYFTRLTVEISGCEPIRYYADYAE